MPLTQFFDPLALYIGPVTYNLHQGYLARLRSTLQGSSLLRVYPLPISQPFSILPHLWAFHFQSISLLRIGTPSLAPSSHAVTIPLGKAQLQRLDPLKKSFTYFRNISPFASTYSHSVYFLKFSDSTWQPRTSAFFPSCSYPPNRQTKIFIKVRLLKLHLLQGFSPC